MNSFIDYTKNFLFGIWHLLQGMYISILNFVRPKITEQYPENRRRRKDFERFRGALVMPHNNENKHRCTGCGICSMNCPNGTIAITAKKSVDESSGKEKRILDTYCYDLGRCTFCGICVQVCPQNAIKWQPNFEHAVFNNSKLLKRLNNEDSSIQQN